MSGSNSILRPTFRSVFNGDGRLCLFLLLATTSQYVKVQSCVREKNIPNGKHAKTAETEQR